MNWCENVILLAVTDSTNNYAMRLIDADKAQAGTLILAGQQAAGKGQRGRQWLDQPGASLLMSLIIQPEIPLNQQFSLSAAVAVAVSAVAAQLLPGVLVSIKWPNDLMLNDKKAGGILIENQLRGSRWLYAVIGIGINCNQTALPGLPHATSLAIEGGNRQDPTELGMRLRNAIYRQLNSLDETTLFQTYKDRLYRKHQWQRFQTKEGIVRARLEEVLPDGRLHVRLEDGSEQLLWHGEWEWLWE